MGGGSTRGAGTPRNSTPAGIVFALLRLAAGAREGAEAVELNSLESEDLGVLVAWEGEAGGAGEVRGKSPAHSFPIPPPQTWSVPGQARVFWVPPPGQRALCKSGKPTRGKTSNMA